MHPCTCLPLAIFSSRWLCLFIIPRAKSKVLLHPWRLIANLTREWSWWFGKMVSMSDPNAVACSFGKIATRDTMALWFDNRTVKKEFSQPSRVGIVLLTRSFHFSHRRHLLVNAYRLALLSNSICQVPSLLEDCLRSLVLLSDSQAISTFLLENCHRTVNVACK